MQREASSFADLLLSCRLSRRIYAEAPHRNQHASSVYHYSSVSVYSTNLCGKTYYSWQRSFAFSESPHSSYDTIMMARDFQVRWNSECEGPIPVSQHILFACSALEEHIASVKSILVKESIGSPSKCARVAVSTPGPKGGRGNCETSWKSGSFQVTIRLQISEIGYGVHPDQIELLIPAIFLQTCSVSSLELGKKMSLSGGQVWFRYK